MARSRGEEARLIWQKSLDNDPPDHDAWYGYAELCLYLGQEDAYRHNRHALLERFGDTSDPIVAERTARACLLLPLPDEDLQRAAVLARPRRHHRGKASLLSILPGYQGVGRVSARSVRQCRRQLPESRRARHMDAGCTPGAGHGALSIRPEGPGPAGSGSCRFVQRLERESRG